MKQITINLKTIDEKPKASSTLIIDLLKKYGVPGSQALKIFQQNRSEYIIRKCFLLDYHIYRKDPITKVDTRRWIQAAIRNDYSESDAFNNWYKAKREYLLENGDSDLKQLVSL